LVFLLQLEIVKVKFKGEFMRCDARNKFPPRVWKFV